MSWITAMMTFHSEKELIPLRGLNELAYCPRLYHLMYVQGIFDNSADTVEGSAEHKRRKARKKAGGDGTETPWGSDAVAHLTLSCSIKGITGKFDVLLNVGDSVVPVEDKHGPAPDGRACFDIGGYELAPEVWYNDQMQLAGQMWLLRANGYSCKSGRVYYRKTKSMVTLTWNDNLEAALDWTICQSRKLNGAPMPPPLHNSEKCIRCSLNHVCLPDETLALDGKLEEPRRLHPGRDHAGVLYLTTPGCKLVKDGDNLRIWQRDQHHDTISAKDVSSVCIFGNAQMSTQVLTDFFHRGISVFYFTSGGWLRGVSMPLTTQNVLLRKQQFLKLSIPDFAIRIARGIVQSKIANQRTLLRRNRSDNLSETLDKLAVYREQAGDADSSETLRGIEGIAARIYWSGFATCLRSDNSGMAMNGRNRRPPRDPVNAMLSYGYTLLMRDCYAAAAQVGLDPLFGGYHTVVPGRPALALDLMEAFRPLIVDSAVLRGVNERAFTKQDFISRPGSCVFKETARKNWIASYERRIDDMITHPAFGYRLSYRRVLHLEARLFARFLEGDISTYTPLTTR
jgi:CRISPR-associated protein Cas1